VCSSFRLHVSVLRAACSSFRLRVSVLRAVCSNAIGLLLYKVKVRSQNLTLYFERSKTILSHSQSETGNEVLKEF
ncbi:hypothetical protein, partial [Nostoc sp.]|uniref:hypothetical protein n=1 Tax=Nostoc sp. TaxID=1180 RepID=UPI002FF76024